MFAWYPCAEARPFDVSDLDRLVDVSEPAPAPGGQAVAYVVAETDVEADEVRSHLALATASGTRALTAGPADHRPRFSPDGSQLAFLRPGEPDGVDQLWVLPLAGGEARRVSSAPGGILDFDWGPDGQRLAVIVEDPPADRPEDAPPEPVVVDRYWFLEDGTGFRTSHHHLALVALATGELTPLLAGETDEELPAFSPDGSRVAFVSRRGPDPDREDWDVFVVEARPGAPVICATSNPTGDNDPEYGSRPAWSPDGERLLVVSQGAAGLAYFAGWRVHVVPADGSGPGVPVFPGLDRDTTAPRFTKDGRSVVALLEDDGTTSVVTGPIGRRPAAVTGPDVLADAFELAGDRVVVLAEDPRHPPEVRVLDKRGRSATWTHDNAWLSEVELAPTERIAFPSADGTEVHGFVVRPAAAGPGPTYLRLHGGPVAQTDVGFRAEAQLLAARGYLVVLPNPRGSSGRGEAWASAIFGEWGGKDTEDVLAAVDLAVTRGWADPARLAVGGWSYGGILTDEVIARDARFRAAVSGAGIGDALAGWGTDQYVRDYVAELGYPWEKPEAWLRNSWPLLHADRITTPTLFLHGAEDVNVPLHGSLQMYQALRARGVPTLLVVYPGEAHGLSRPSFVRDKAERIVGWLDRWLAPG